MNLKNSMLSERSQTHDSISMKCPEQTNLKQQKVDWWLLIYGEREKEESLLIGIRFLFWGDENVLKLDSDAGFTIL